MRKEYNEKKNMNANRGIEECIFIQLQLTCWDWGECFHLATGRTVMMFLTELGSEEILLWECRLIATGNTVLIVLCKAAVSGRALASSSARSFTQWWTTCLFFPPPCLPPYLSSSGLALTSNFITFFFVFSFSSSSSFYGFLHFAASPRDK